jgi:multiple antibiotic resistance protein
MKIQELLKTFVVLWAVIDPIGSIPVFLEATKNFEDKIRKKVALRACLIASLVLIFFIVVGQIIIESMKISLSAFQISGGVVLFLFAMTMIFGHGKPEDDKSMIRDFTHVTVFPIAIPSIASPGAMMAVVLLTDNHRFTFFQQFQTSLVMLFVIITTLFLLLIARRVQRLIGETGITVISKIMGLILASVAVESILAGLKEYFSL